MFIVQVTEAIIVNYNRNTFTVWATGPKDFHAIGFFFGQISD